MSAMHQKRDKEKFLTGRIRLGQTLQSDVLMSVEYHCNCFNQGRFYPNACEVSLSFCQLSLHKAGIPSEHLQITTDYLLSLQSGTLLPLSLFKNDVFSYVKRLNKQGYGHL